jgi:hypothetical protein
MPLLGETEQRSSWKAPNGQTKVRPEGGAHCGEGIPMPSAVADRHAERVLESLCAFCLQPFEPTRPNQRFYRPSCRKAHFDQRRERRPDLFLACADAIESAVFDQLNSR